MFKPIKDYPNYEVSTNGEIRNILTGKILKPYITKKGYLAISLTKNNVKNNFKIHRLVATTFIPNPLNLETVNHIDGCKMNNNVANLEWLSHLDNVRHAINTNLIVRKLTINDVKEIKKLISNANITESEIAKLFNVSTSSIKDIKKGRRWASVKI